MNKSLLIADLQTSKSLIKGIRNDVFGKLRKNIGFNAVVGDVLDYEQPQPYIVENTEYTAEGIPVLTANKAFVLGYTSETNGIYDKGDCIIFDDFTLDCKYVDFPFKVKSSAIKILKVHKDIEIDYVAMFMSITKLVGDTHKRYWISEYSKLEMPLPPYKEQKRIINRIKLLLNRLDTIIECL